VASDHILHFWQYVCHGDRGGKCPDILTVNLVLCIFFYHGVWRRAQRMARYFNSVCGGVCGKWLDISIEKGFVLCFDPSPTPTPPPPHPPPPPGTSITILATTIPSMLLCTVPLLLPTVFLHPMILSFSSRTLRFVFISWRQSLRNINGVHQQKFVSQGKMILKISVPYIFPDKCIWSNYVPVWATCTFLTKLFSWPVHSALCAVT
jgi:hypothetical protein